MWTLLVTLFYPGGRQADDIVRWLLKRTGPPATHLTDVDQAKSFADSNEVVVIGFFEDGESTEAKALAEAADSYDDLPFGISLSKDVAEALEAQMNTVVVFKKVGVMLNIPAILMFAVQHCNEMCNILMH